MANERVPFIRFGGGRSPKPACDILVFEAAGHTVLQAATLAGLMAFNDLGYEFEDEFLVVLRDDQADEAFAVIDQRQLRTLVVA